MTSDIRVLCVDDDPQIPSLISERFDHSDPEIEVVAETSPADALDRLDEERIDCVVSGYRMPEIDGLELLEAVRERKDVLPFILFTEEGNEAVAAEAVRAGATDYVRKSTGTDRYELLADRVRNAVDGRRRRISDEMLFDAVDEAVFVVDVETGDVIDANSAARTLLGCDEASLAELTLDDLDASVPDADEAAVTEWLRSDDNLQADAVDWDCTSADGDPLRMEVNVRRVPYAGDRRALVTARDVTTRRRREGSRDVLLSRTRELMTMTAKESILNSAVTTATELFGATVNRAYLLEDAGGSSRPAAATDEARAVLSDEEMTVDVAVEDLIFSGTSGRRYDLSVGDDAPDGLAAELTVPLGEHGVLYVGTTDGGEFDRYELDLAQILAAHVGGALDRADRDRLLRDRERELADRRDELKSLNDMNEVIRDVNQTLVHVSTRDEIERLVCEQFAGADQYQFAWLGRYDLEAGAVTPQFWAGVGDGYVTESPIAVGADSDDEVLSGAVESRDVTVIPDVTRSDLSAERIEMARARGYRSVAVVPVTYQDLLYDVLVVYATSREAFGPKERDVLAELGETIGYAISTAQRHSARVDAGVVELTIALRDSKSFLVGLSDAVDSEVELVGRSLLTDGRLHLFVRVSGAAGDAVSAWAEDVSTVDDVRVLGDGEEPVYEVAIRESPLVESVANHGATLSAARAENGEARVVVEVRENADIRRLVELLESDFEEAELVSRSDRTERSGAGVDDDPWSALTARLTDRQREVLQVAYHSGFFEWPRAQNGEVVAEHLDISQPTFHQHLRVGQRELLAGVFERGE